MGLTVPIYSSGTGTLLWENPNPESSYSGQKVSIDLSKYTHVFIVFKYYMLSQNSESWLFIRVGFTDNVIRSTNYTTLVQRTALVEKDGVKFGQGMSGSGQNNNYMIPYQIYGIK